MGKNNASMTNPNLLIQAGIDPKTGLPIRIANALIGCGKGDIKKQLRIVDEQNAINRYTWYNLPEGLSAQLLERILYYKGQGMMFQLQDKFYFLPYALNGTIDVYGRFTGVTPLPFNGTSNDGKEDKPWIQGLVYEPFYDVLMPEDYVDDDGMPDIEKILDAATHKCVLLKDYTEQYSQTIIPRQQLNDPLLDVMADCIPFMRTSLLNSTGVMGMRVGTENEQASVDAASNAINKAALEGRKYVGIVGAIDFQELTGGTVAKAEEFMLAMQSLDNYRLSLYGLDNGGLFQKRAHMLAAEQAMTGGSVGLVQEDGLRNRQRFCTLANSLWGFDMWCEPSEASIGMDRNGDLAAGSDETQENSPVSPTNTNEGGNEE